MNKGALQAALCDVLASATTPFKPDLSLDLDGLTRNLEFLLDKGLRVYVCCGSVAEVSSMTDEERQAVTQCHVEVIGDRGIVVAGVSHSSLTETIRMSRLARDAGAQAVMLTPPYYLKGTSDGLFEFFRRFDAETALPFIAYNNPDATQHFLSVDLVGRIAGLLNFVALKESSTDLYHFWGLMERFKGQFPVIAAAEVVIPFHMLAGADGMMTLLPVIVPQMMRELLQAARDGDAGRVMDLCGPVYRFREVLAPALAEGYTAYVSYTKAAYDLMGLAGGPCRPPLPTLGSVEREALSRVLRDDLGVDC